MFKFLAKHSGKICTVFAVTGIVIGLGALIAAPYVVVPICVGITVGVFLGIGLIAGACYIGREYGKYVERESNKANEEKIKEEKLKNLNNEHSSERRAEKSNQFFEKLRYKISVGLC